MYAEIALTVLLLVGVWVTWYAMTHSNDQS